MNQDESPKRTLVELLVDNNGFVECEGRKIDTIIPVYKPIILEGIAPLNLNPKETKGYKRAEIVSHAPEKANSYLMMDRGVVTSDPFTYLHEFILSVQYFICTFKEAK